MTTFLDFENAVMKSLVHYNTNHTSQINKICVTNLIKHMRGAFVFSLEGPFHIDQCLHYFKKYFYTYTNQEIPQYLMKRIKHELRKREHESIDPMCPDKKVKYLTLWELRVMKSGNLRNMANNSRSLTYH